MDKPTVAIVGSFQNGKSTFVNCLLDDKVAQPGLDGGGKHTTHIPTTYTFGEIQDVKLHRENGSDESIHLRNFLQRSSEGQLVEYTSATVSLWKPILNDISIIDTPGYNADDVADANITKALEKADSVVLVVNSKAMGEHDRMLQKRIADYKLPYVVVMNCLARDRSWNPDAKTNEKVEGEWNSAIKNNGFNPYPITLKGPLVWRCNLKWFWIASGHAYDDDEAEFNEDQEDVKRLLKIDSDGDIDPQLLRDKSRFLPVREFFQSRTFNVLSANSGITHAKLEMAVRDWSDRIEEVLGNAAKELS